MTVLLSLLRSLLRTFLRSSLRHLHRCVFALAAPSRQSLTASTSAPLTRSAGEAQASTTGDTFLSSDLRQTFEAMLFEATGGTDMRDLAVLKTRLLALVPRYFPTQYIARRSTSPGPQRSWSGMWTTGLHSAA